LLSALKKSVNVKKARMINYGEKLPSAFVVKDFGKGKIYLNINASSELKQEWELSELMRLVQDARKKAGLTPGQKVVLELSTDDEAFVKKHKEKIEEKTSVQIKLVHGLNKEKLVDREFGFEIKK